MTAEVSLVLESAAHTLTIPSAAIEEPAEARPADASRGAEATVRVVNLEGLAERRTVRVGINNRINVQILAGLSAGDRVVIREDSASDHAARRSFGLF